MKMVKNNMVAIKWIWMTMKIETKIANFESDGAASFGVFEILFVCDRAFVGVCLVDDAEKHDCIARLRECSEPQHGEILISFKFKYL